MKIDKENITDDEKIEWISEVLKCFSIARAKYGHLANNPDAILYAWTILDSRDLLPEPVVEIQYVEKPLLTPAAKLEYNRWAYMQRKKLKEQKDAQKKTELKIKQALARKKSFCIVCQQMVDVISPSYEIKQKKNDIRKRIHVKSICPQCNSPVVAWGGYVAE